MPFNQFDVSTGFKAGADAGKTAGGVFDAFDEERKSQRALSDYESKKKIDARYDTKVNGKKGIYSYNPLTKKVELEGEIPENAMIRNTTTADDIRNKYSLRNEFESPTQTEVQGKVNAEELVGKSRELQRILSEDKDYFGGIGSTKIKAKVPFNAFDEKAQRYEFVRSDMADRILRLRSGASINEQEFKRLSSLLPSVGRFDKVDIQNLQDFEREFSTLAGRINSGAKWDELTQSFKGTGGNQNPLQQAAQSQSGSSGNALRQEAQQAISRGADPKKVAERYRQQTGEEF